MCVNLSSSPNFLIAATESPPPTIDVASVSAIASATFSVPIQYLSNSHTPSGPFHNIVLDPCNSSVNFLNVRGPISNP